MLPRPLWNPRLYDMAGRFIAFPDAWFDDVGMAWEIDSKEWHLSPADYEATVLRRSVLGALDVELVQTLPQTLDASPCVILTELERTYLKAGRRPRPQLVAVPAPTTGTSVA